jgi:molecular chaperone Hsp33
MSETEPSDAPLSLPADDAVIVFRTVRSNVHGRLVRLGASADKILRPHAMPDAASEALGEALALAALLGSALQGEGNISVQTRTDGAVSVLFADCQAPGKLRGYARFDAEKLTSETVRTVLGDGHLAITIEQGDVADRYQGVMALDGVSLAVAAAAYFEQRENIATFVHLAVAKHYAATEAGLPAVMHWRGGGIMMQKLAADHDETDDDPWRRVRMLAETTEDHELLDPALTPERLLLRLFHEEGVIIERVIPLTPYCKCSRDRVLNVLVTFGAEELADLRDDKGNIAVTCEFCAATYAFELSEIGAPKIAE